MNILDVDEAIGFVNKLIDNIRCATCDKLDGSRLRYPCGHTACEECVVYTEQCPLCSPSGSDAAPQLDVPLTQTVKHAIDLLHACQNLFDPEAFQRKRISEQQKIEKELFPECIQAPMKYENKRKSWRYSLNNKENRYSTILPGEAVTSLRDSKMENSVTYVQKWLKENEKDLSRRPFTDLNVNTQRVNNSTNKKQLRTANRINNNRKRSHFKTTDKSYIYNSINLKSKYESSVTPKKIKKEHSYNLKEVQHCDNDESGIFMENETIVIDDSQETFIDKDKRAWLAVLEAHNKEALKSTSLNNTSHINKESIDIPKQIINSNIYDIEANTVFKVPFLKRSAIYETCTYCRNEVKSVPLQKITKPVLAPCPAKPVKITIDADNFVTTITVIDVEPNRKVIDKKTMAIQTDIVDIRTADNVKQAIESNMYNAADKHETSPTKPTSECDTYSVDLFADDNKIFGPVLKAKELQKHVVIEESDSDSELEASGPRSVQAEVHRSCEEIEYGILTDIVNVSEHAAKVRRGPRGYTPTSTDSSEKENYNPNRMRRHAPANKKSRKK